MGAGPSQMTEHWLVRVSKAWKIVSDSVRERYRQSNKRRLFESLLGYSGSFAFSLFMIFSVAFPIPSVEGIGFNAAKPTLLHAFAALGALTIFPLYGRSLTMIIRSFDEIPIRYIKYIIRTRKSVRELQ